MLREGTSAPNFTVQAYPGGNVTLEQFKGRQVVLFFYPKDDTPGCTKESCEFRDLAGEFEKAGAVVFGVSADDLKSHESFAAKYNLNFPLLADTDQAICKAYGVWGEQEWQGKKYMGIARTTYVIDAEGVVKKIFEKVNPVGHADQVLQVVRG